MLQESWHAADGNDWFVIWQNWETATQMPSYRRNMISWWITWNFRALCFSVHFSTCWDLLSERNFVEFKWMFLMAHQSSASELFYSNVFKCHYCAVYLKLYYAVLLTVLLKLYLIVWFLALLSIFCLFVWTEWPVRQILWMHVVGIVELRIRRGLSSDTLLTFWTFSCPLVKTRSSAVTCWRQICRDSWTLSYSSWYKCQRCEC